MKKIVSAMAAAALLIAAAGSSAFAGEITKTEAGESMRSIQVVRASEADDDEFFISYSITAGDAMDFEVNTDVPYLEGDFEEGEFMVTLSASVMDMAEFISDSKELTDEEKNTLLALVEKAQPLEDQMNALYEDLEQASEDAAEAIWEKIERLQKSIDEIYSQEEALFEKLGQEEALFEELGLMTTIIVTEADGTFYINGKKVDTKEFDFDAPMLFETAPATKTSL